MNTWKLQLFSYSIIEYLNSWIQVSSITYMTTSLIFSSFQKYFFLILFKAYFSYTYFFFNKLLNDWNVTSEIHFLHLYFYFKINRLFHFHNFTFFYQRKFFNIFFFFFGSQLLHKGNSTFFHSRHSYLIIVFDFTLTYHKISPNTEIFELDYSLDQ